MTKGRDGGWQRRRLGELPSAPSPPPSNSLVQPSVTYPALLAVGSPKQPTPQSIVFPCQALSLKGIHVTMSPLPIMSKIVPRITACEHNNNIPTLL